jgi:hypothetical protein
MLELCRRELEQVRTGIQSGYHVEVIGEPEPLEVEGDEWLDGLQVIGISRDKRV